jgi:hypothetical protein
VPLTKARGAHALEQSIQKALQIQSADYGAQLIDVRESVQGADLLARQQKGERLIKLNELFRRLALLTHIRSSYYRFSLRGWNIGLWHEREILRGAGRIDELKQSPVRPRFNHFPSTMCGDIVISHFCPPF